MSALSTSFGIFYRLDPDGFMPLSSNPGDCDQILCVTTPTDPENQVTQVLNAVAAIPAGTTRWTVSYQALKLAPLGGTKCSLVPA